MDIITLAIEEAVRAGRARCTPDDPVTLARGEGIAVAMDAYHALAVARGWRHDVQRAPMCWEQVLGLDPEDIEEHAHEISAAMRAALEG